RDLQCAYAAGQRCAASQFRCGRGWWFSAKSGGLKEDLRMRILQPAEWSKPRGFSHGVELDGPGKWIVLAGQTGGDEKGDYAPDMAAQVGTALKRIVKLLGEAGAGPEHIVRRSEEHTSELQSLAYL